MGIGGYNSQSMDQIKERYSLKSFSVNGYLQKKTAIWRRSCSVRGGADMTNQIARLLRKKIKGERIKKKQISDGFKKKGRETKSFKLGANERKKEKKEEKFDTS